MKSFIFIRYLFITFPVLLISNMLLLVLAGLVDAASIFTLAPVVDLLINSDLQNSSAITQRVAMVIASVGLPVTLSTLLAVFVVLNVVKSGFQIFAMHLILRTKYALLRDLMVGTFEDFFEANWYFFSSNKQGKLINTFNREVAGIGDAFGAIGRLFAAILQGLLYFAVPFYISWQVTTVSVVTALLFAVPFLLLGKINYQLGKLNTTTGNQMISVIHESLGLSKVILGFANQRKSIEMLRSAYEAHCRATLKSQTLGLAIPMMYVPLGLIVLIGSLLMARQLEISLSELSIVMYSLFKAIPLVGQITGMKSRLDNFIPSYEQVISLRQQARQLKQQTGSKTFTRFNDKIALKGLSFAYPSHEPTLFDINVCILQGKMVAFVGESGAGKSTLIDIIMGIHEPQRGKVSIDGIPLPDFDIYSYRQRIGYVPQESVLFNMSIRDNLLWANEAASDEEIKQACQQANAADFIEEFPEGYDTVVGDRGLRLSGGQAQRIALARAILRKPSLLILDEATSSLDTHSERLIQQAIENIAKETTVVVIAHRLSTIAKADYIYVLEKGKVVEEGCYSTLMSMDGRFKQMVQLQALNERQ